MVLVYDKPRSAIGILQTKLRYREGHEARRSGLETIPLDQYVEGRHGEGEPGVKIRRMVKKCNRLTSQAVTHPL